MTSILSSLFSLFFTSTPGQTEDNPLCVDATPGLITLLDLALFRSNESQLTATICSSHALLTCWLEVKYQSQILLQSLGYEEDSQVKVLCESFARQSLESSMDAIERLSTDKFAQSANLSDPYESISSTVTTHHHNLLSGVGAQGIATGILESKEDTGRRTPIQRRRDCWESPRLFCPDHVWADDAYSSCQRWIRNLTKHSYIVKEKDSLAAPLTSAGNSSSAALSAIRLSNETEQQASLLVNLIQDDLPIRLFHFRQAMEAEAVVTKRLYLVKCEYRAPFRAFLEAHQGLLRAPPVDLVDQYLEQKGSPESADALKSKFQSLLRSPKLIELLALEKECEQIELDMGQTLFPFTELARSLDHKRARLKAVPGILDEDQLPSLNETVRRLKSILCRKGGPETSTGIRPILLDLQGVPRDDQAQTPEDDFEKETLEERVDFFLSELQILASLIKTKNAFSTSKQNNDIDFSFSIVKGCTEQFDEELFRCQLLDWFAIIERQHVTLGNSNLPDEIRQAEIRMSIAGASVQSLKLVKERLEMMQNDREQRLEVLKEMVEEVCLREMNLYVQLNGPDPRQTLVLKETSALGFLGAALKLAGEPLPLG